MYFDHHNLLNAAVRFWRAFRRYLQDNFLALFSRKSFSRVYPGYFFCLRNILANILQQSQYKASDFALQRIKRGPPYTLVLPGIETLS